ncbi:replication initiation protein [uncultured Chryseobacterium sp.]|uniref:replication initiation protein n=1 Tax=uncultured Chryseobacterium sp. TaxID=259322 RepID=UPI0025D99D75|nr:replication initiation protein [uncultured Chryseobacterium sp.]
MTTLTDHKRSKNYFYQTNVFNEAILYDLSDIQREIIYFLQYEIDYHSDENNGEIYFDYHRFLEFKGVKRNNTYTPDEIISFAREIIVTTGVLYNVKRNEITFFNIFDNIIVDRNCPENFHVKFAEWGKIFFFEKFAKEYAKESKIQYTQLEANLISLKGGKRRKLYEALAQFKGSGMFMIELDVLRERLGFSIYDYGSSENTLFPERVIVKEHFREWKEFHKFFLKPAVEEINKSESLNIRDLKFTTTKKGRKVHGLVFTFNKKSTSEILTQDQRLHLEYFKTLGLQETQIIKLFNDVGIEQMYSRIEDKIYHSVPNTGNKIQDMRNSVWRDRSDHKPINNIGGFLWKNIFPELH